MLNHPRPVNVALLLLLFFLLPLPSLAAGDARSADDARGRLIIFVGDEATFANADLRSRLDEYRTVAGELDVTLDVLNVDAGAPPEVVGTPLIVFQNDRGRSIYQGRYATLDRLRNFVRTSRVIPQSPEPLVRTDVPTWEDERLRIVASIKLTELAGQLPDGFDAERFRVEAIDAITSGMKRFLKNPRVELGRGDRSFYLDVHPYHADGLLFLSCELYSQFNCHVPIYSALDDPIVGFWDERAVLFADAGAQLEAALHWSLSSAPSLDAYSAVSIATPVATWEQLGLALPERLTRLPVGDAALATIPRRWVVDAGAPQTVLFRFAPPLDNYAGEARAATGELRLGATEPGSGASLVFRVPVASITMGDPLLDRDLQSEHFLDGEKHPVSTFTLDTLESESTELRYGEQSRITMSGVFGLKGVGLPITVRGTLEPVLDDASRPRLLLSADWSIRLRETFALEGPEGPSPARDTVLFTCQFTLRPSEAASKTEE